jgi:A/G-specific adenine glycosylase
MIHRHSPGKSQSSLAVPQKQTPPPLSVELLHWYDRHRRVMPWRAVPGQRPDPYAVWLSEIMLQQTTVAAVKPYFEAFLRRWPTVHALAAADSADVMAAWAGLGYYARARNLHRCAQVIVSELNGRFPTAETELLTLPGIGPYTAAAIAAIAFDRRAVVVDGNVERVMARIFAVTEALPKSKLRLRQLADTLTPEQRSGDYAQAVMDLGATVCTPKSPACIICPWLSHCAAHAQGIAASLPRKLAKKATPTRHGVAFCVVSPDQKTLLVRRPPKGLLGGMLAFPSTEWRGATWTEAAAVRSAPLTARWKALPQIVEHTFTHFHLKLQVWVASNPKRCARAVPDAQWVALDALSTIGLPNVMQKAATILRDSQPIARHRAAKPRPPKTDKRRRAL